MMRRLLGTCLAAFTIAGLALPARLAADATYHHRGTPVVNGVEGAGEWQGAVAGSDEIVLPPAFGGGTSTVAFLVMNDDSYLYLAVRLPYGISPPANDQFLALIDLSWEAGLDLCAPATVLDQPAVYSQYDNQIHKDLFADHLANCQFQYYVTDVSSGGTIDGAGAWGADGSTTFFELAQPLDDADDDHDLSVAVTDRIQMIMVGLACDGFDCGQAAQVLRRVYLEPANYIFLGDFERGTTSGWSATVP